MLWDLKVPLLVLFHVFVNTKCGLRVVIDLVDSLWGLLLGELGSMLSMAGCRLVSMTCLFAEEELDLLLDSRIGLLLRGNYH